MPPWESPSQDDIHELWSQIFNDAFDIEEMEFVVFKLLSYLHISKSHLSQITLIVQIIGR